MSNVIEYTKELIRIPSVSGNEGACLEYIYGWMTAAGFEELVITNDYAAGCKRGKDSTKALILTGHVDTVSEGRIDAWATPPWKPIIKGDKLYGLGATDMKGGVAAGMAALERVAEPAVDTWLVAVANEEIDGSGTAAFANYFAKNYKYSSTSAIIPEPTNLDHIEIGHRGNVFVKLTFHGSAAHGSQQASFTASALGLATVFLANIDTIAVDMANAFSDSMLGKPTIVPTGIFAGSPSSPNKTSDEADMTLDIRTTPALDAMFSEWLVQLGREYYFTWKYIAKPVASCWCESTAPIVQKLQRLAGGLPITVSHGATDQAFLQAIGIDTVIFGPGNFKQAHSQNEWLSCRKLQDATNLYIELLKP